MSAASSDPLRPEPMIIIFILFPSRVTPEPDVAGSILQSVLGEPPQLIPPEGALMLDAEEDEVRSPLGRFVYHSVAGLPGLKELSRHLKVHVLGYLLGLGQDLLAAFSLGRQIGVKGEGALHLNHMHYVTLPLVALGDIAGQGHGFQPCLSATGGDR